MEYIIYMDESGKEGPYYSNFYGGALIRSTHHMVVENELRKLKDELGFTKEVKWQRVTLQYLDKYMKLVDKFFYYIRNDIIKVRIMFTHNYHKAVNLTKQQMDDGFLLLYYQFLKHAFGLQYSNPNPDKEIKLRLYFDELPVSPREKKRFKHYIHNLQYLSEFQNANIIIKEDQITEVKSHDHVILQYMDIILGSMYFRLNDFHKVKPEGSYRRGKRTIAKHKLYKYINSHIRSIIPNFNIGITTGVKRIEDRWEMPYRHWKFVSRGSKVAPEYSKKINKS